MEILRCSHLTKTYKTGSNQVVALDNVDLALEKGSFTAIVGASGSGKSTLLHLLGGVDRPTSGNIYIEDTDISTLNMEELAVFRRRKVGLVYQFYNLIPTLNVRKNILLPILLDGRKPDEARFEQIVNTLGLSDRLSHLPRELSGGQQQRVAIARALAKNPKLLLCDEPTGALDYNTGKAVLKLLQGTCREMGRTVIVITHNQALTAMADRVITVKSGTVADMTMNDNIVDVSEIEW